MIQRDPSSSSTALELKDWTHSGDSIVDVPPSERRSEPLMPVIFDVERHSRPFKRWFPWLVPSFVVTNVALFVITILGKLGALQMHKVVHKHQVWRLFSCIWLHGGVIHVLANMFSLVLIGIPFEQEFGFVRIGLLYVISGFGGSLLSSLFIHSGISVGASGAIFGLLGAMLSELLTNWTIYANKFAALSTLIVIIIINLAAGILPHMDNFAHIGGFISGFFLGFVFLIRPQYKWVSQTNSHSGFVAPPVNSKHKPYQYATQMGNQLNMTCLSNGKSGTFSVSNSFHSQAQQLCSQLCS
ncbi:unnamed protein product [Lupinus luteus]|uniref:RHOMBOID-like protein n=1 Tax=Lupinus luteus TaxID=3873 RepID=A0AAV1W541_LUPLU